MKKFSTIFFTICLLALPIFSVSTKAGNNTIFIQIGVEDIDQDLAVLRTKYFHTYITIRETKPTRIYLFYKDSNKRGDFFDGDSLFKKDLMAELWNTFLVTSPDKGARPWEWPLAIVGEFPNDRYSLNMV